MLKSVEGIFRDGKVELLESPPQMVESRVLVTFLPPGGRIELKDRGIDPSQAADLRARLGTFHQDLDRPDMDIYDEV
jgi:hypothetical protein